MHSNKILKTPNEGKIWREFLELYKSLPALWKSKSKIYCNRPLKIRSYQKLVNKLRESYPDATRETVVRKINTFRTNYRRELKRIQKSAQEVSEGKKGANEVYRSTLWYFDLLSFLHESNNQDDEDEDCEMNEEQDLEISTEDNKFDVEPEILEELTIEAMNSIKSEDITQTGQNYWRVESAPQKKPPSSAKKLKRKAPKIRRTTRLPQITTNIQSSADTTSIDNTVTLSSSQMQSLITQLKEMNSETALLSRTWANQFAELDNRQKIFARKLISDVLFYGCMGQLYVETQIDNLAQPQ